MFDEPLRLGYVGLGWPKKGLDEVNWLADRLAGTGIEVHHFGKLRADASEHVHVHGPYDNEVLPELLDRAGIQVVLLPAPYAETFGHVLTEAFVAGRPVIGDVLRSAGRAHPRRRARLDGRPRGPAVDRGPGAGAGPPPARDPPGGERGARPRAPSGRGDGRQVRQHLPAAGIVRTLGGGGNMSEERLRRQLRAQAVVNRQLHAQLAEVTAQLKAVQGNDASAVRVLWGRLEAVLPNRVASKVERRLRGALGTPPRPRRRPAASSGGPVGEWLDDLVAAPSSAPVSLARLDEDTMFLLEGTQKRPISRMLVGALLEADLGPARPITESELDEYDEGPPVEVLAAPTGFPFVVMGGRRRPIRGYPVPLVIDEDDADRFEQGEPLRVARIAAGGRQCAAAPAGGDPAQPGPRPMARVTERARSTAWWGRIEILAVVVASLVPRLMTVGNFQTIDETLWTRRVQVFSDALDELRALQGLGHRRAQPVRRNARHHARCADDVARQHRPPGVGNRARRGPDRGEVDLLREPRLGLAAAQLSVAVATSLLIGLVVWLVARWAASPRAGLVAGLLLATEPFWVAHGSVIHTDELTTLFGLSGLLALGLVLGVPRVDERYLHRRGLAVLAGFLLVCSPLTKISGLAFAPGALLIVGWAAVRAIRSRDPEVSAASALKPLGRAFAVVALVAVATVLVLWPAVWADPGTQLDRLRDSVGIGYHDRATFFLGEVRRSSIPIFYAVAMPFRMTPWMLAGLVVGVPVALARRSTRPTPRSSSQPSSRSCTRSAPLDSRSTATGCSCSDRWSWRSASRRLLVPRETPRTTAWVRWGCSVWACWRRCTRRSSRLGAWGTTTRCWAAAALRRTTCRWAGRKARRSRAAG